MLLAQMLSHGPRLKGPHVKDGKVIGNPPIRDLNSSRICSRLCTSTPQPPSAFYTKKDYRGILVLDPRCKECVKVLMRNYRKKRKEARRGTTL